MGFKRKHPMPSGNTSRKRFKPMGEKLKPIHKTEQFRKEFAELTGGQKFMLQNKFKKGKKSKKATKISERKEKRKAERKFKKAKKLAFAQHKSMPKPELEKQKQEKEKAAEVKKKKEEKKRQREKKRKKSLKEKKKKEIVLEKEKKEKEDTIRKQNLRKDIKREEKELKQLEKQLYLNKRKGKGLPQSFVNDGLDYILDAVDSDKIGGIVETEESVDYSLNADSSTDEDEDSQWLRSKQKKARLQHAEVQDDDDEDEDDDDDDEDDYDDDEMEEEEDLDDDIDCDDVVESDSNENESEVRDKKQQLIDQLMAQIKPMKPNSKLKTSELQDDLENVKGKSILKKSKVKGQQDKAKHVSFISEGDQEQSKKRSEEVTDSSDDYDDEYIDDNVDVDDDDDEEDDDGDDDDDDDDVSDDEDDSDVDAINSENELDKDLQTNEVKKTTSKLKLKQSGIEKSENMIEKPALKEDIYGRLRDSGGNIVKDTKQTGSYVPPGKRLAMAGVQENSFQKERLKKQLKGLVNRVSSSNMSVISSQIEELYQTNSRADTNDLLTSLIIDACVTTVTTPERLIMELIMLLTILNGNVGTEVGAIFCQTLAERFESLCKNGYEEDKEMDNVILLFCYLYNFKVIHSLLITDLIRKFTETFGEKDIELLLLILKNVGFTLRKDDPVGLKELIQQIQTKASTMDTGQFVEKSRVKFMLEILMAIKNNNMRKIPNYDPDHFESLKKQIRMFLRGSLGVDQLRISLADLVEARNRGRWWVVGSAWEGRNDLSPIQGSGSSNIDAILGENTDSSKLLGLAKKQRMNTDVRRNIFCVVMSSEDYIDAFEKLTQLGLKHMQQREVIHIIMDCCQQEKSFNPYYAYLIQKFCEFDRSFQMTYQYTMWDRFKEIQTLSDRIKDNLAKMMIHLLTSKAVSLSIFKVVEFGTLNKFMVRFLKQVLLGLLLDYPQDVMEVVFLRIAPLHKLKTLHEGLKLFMQHFLLRKKSPDVENHELLKERVALANKALNSSQSKMLL